MDLISNFKYNSKIHVVNGWYLIDFYIKGSLEMGLYERIDENGVAEYVIANAGSSPPSEEFEDWEQNYKQFFKGASEDVENSVIWATEQVDRYSITGSIITFVGHSKGGAEAAANALANNRNAILFNPEWLNIQTYERYENNYTGTINSYVVYGDVLDMLQEKYISMDNGMYRDRVWQPESKTYLPIMSTNPVENHLMYSVKNALKAKRNFDNLADQWRGMDWRRN